MSSRSRILLACIVTSCAFAGIASARHGAPPLSRKTPGLTPLSEVGALELPFVDNELLLDEDEAERAVVKGPQRYALVAEVLVTPDSGGTWDVLPDGSRLWRLRVHSPGATDVNLGFTRFDLPPGATLHAWSQADASSYEGPYTAADVRDHRELWTPVVAGDRVVVELVVPPGAATPRLELGAVGHGYRDWLRTIAREPVKSGSCNVDVVCPDGDAWRDEIDSVAVYSLGGGLACTGTMIMDVPGDFTPYFLTANHCGVGPGNAASLVVCWNFQAQTCGGPRNGSLADNQTGSTFRSGLDGPDFTLVELDAMPDPAWDVSWAGWDRSDAIPTGSVGIHHPSTDEKAITFNDDPLTHGNSCIRVATDTHWWIDDYERGTTEPGSSGSGLWDDTTHLLIGQLSGGTASCTNVNHDCYGRFAVGWDTGARPDARLRDWLDPGGSGALQVTGGRPASGQAADDVTIACAQRRLASTAFKRCSTRARERGTTRPSPCLRSSSRPCFSRRSS
jgi:hypothetical protein